MVSLSGCGGCGAVLLNNQPVLAELTKHADIIFCPMLMDAEEFGEVDIAVVDGAVRAKEDEEKLQEARNKSRVLVAWGTCAAFGGIPALANRYELEQLIEQSYGQTLDPLAFYFSEGKSPESLESLAQETGLLRKAGKVSDFVRANYLLPGCPPDPSILSDLTKELVGETQGRDVKQIVCSECHRRPRPGVPENPRLVPGAGTDSKICLLSQGALCLGFLTRAGCGAPCTRGGFPCWGCRGPSQSQMNKMNDGDYFEELMLTALSKRWKLDEEQVRPLVKLLRCTGGSALGFAQNFAPDTSRLR
jgi:F420-non-reducing hydrogenase small subunit